MTSGYEEALRRVRAAARTGSAVLDLEALGLEELPPGIDALSNLRELNLADNRLSPAGPLPDALAALTRLRVLDLSGNRLNEVPRLDGLAQLVRLVLARNRIAELPAWLADLPGLAMLDVSDNRLVALPGALSRMAALTALDLSRNQLTALPDDLTGLRALTDLSLAYNEGLELPRRLAEWTGLTRLDLSHTGLERLPDSLGELTGLVALYLTGNRLTALPVGLGRLRHLAVLETDGNHPLTEPPPEIVAGGTAAMLRYLRALGRGEARQWRSKILVVGQAGAGKTSLSKMLRGLAYDPDEPRTHGVRVDALPLPHPRFPGVTMDMAVWDFGGQLEYRATQRFYLTDRSLFLLVWHTRLGWRAEAGRIVPWLTAIRSAAPDSPVIIVATHCKGSVDDLDEAGLRRQYPNIVKAMRVDCSDGTGGRELYDKIAEVAAGLPLMGASWPQAWEDATLALLKPFENAPVTPDSLHEHDSDPAAPHVPAPAAPPYADLAQVTRTLTESGVDDPDERTQLLAALHDRGQILHFAREVRLRDLVVLEPTWIDTMITKVLDSQEVADRGGLLSRAHRAALWPDLPPGLDDKLTALMEPFDLAYGIDAPDHDDVALVVERLRASRPARLPVGWETALRSIGATELRLTYKLSSRQAGVPSWFIAREHRYTTESAWSRGVVLRHHNAPVDAWALLEDDDSVQPTIRLAVRGSAPHGFLSLLDEAFTGILRERYQGLGVTRMVPCPCGGVGAGAGAGASAARARGMIESISFNASLDIDISASRSGCAHEFDYDAALAALVGEHQIQCPKTFRMLDPGQLLIGLPPRRSGDMASTRMEGKIDRLLQEVTRMEETQLLVLDTIRGLMNDRAKQGTHCPSIFTVVEVTPQARYERIRQKLTGVRHFQLQLYCERPEAPHPLERGAGVYQLSGLPQWLHDYAPYLRTLLNVLKVSLPMLVPVLGGVGVALTDATRDQLDLACKLIDHLAELRAAPGTVTGGGPRTEADFRKLRQELSRIAPDFGGLVECVLPENHGVAYLCPEHAEHLEYPARRS